MKFRLGRLATFLLFCETVLAYINIHNTRRKRDVTSWKPDPSSIMEPSSSHLSVTYLRATRLATIYLQKQPVPPVDKIRLFISAINQNSKYVIKFLLISSTKRKAVIFIHLCVIASLGMIFMSDAFQKNIKNTVSNIKQSSLHKQIALWRESNLKAIKLWFIAISRQSDAMVTVIQTTNPTVKIQGKSNAIIKESKYLLNAGNLNESEKERFEWNFDDERQEGEENSRRIKPQENDDASSAEEIEKEEIMGEEISKAQLKNIEEMKALDLNQILEVERIWTLEASLYKSIATKEAQDSGDELRTAHNNADAKRAVEMEIIDKGAVSVKEVEKGKMIQAEIKNNQQEEIKQIQTKNVEKIDAVELTQALETQRRNTENGAARDLTIIDEIQTLEASHYMNTATKDAQDYGDELQIAHDADSKRAVEMEIVDEDALSAKEVDKEEMIQEEIKKAQQKNIEEIEALELTQALEAERKRGEEWDAKSSLKREEKRLEKRQNDKARAIAFAELRVIQLANGSVPSITESLNETQNVVVKVETVQERIKEAQLKNIEEIKALELTQAQEALRRGGFEAIQRDKKAFELRNQERAARLALIVKAKEEEEEKLSATILKLEEETRALMIARANEHQSQLANEIADLKVIPYHESIGINAVMKGGDSLSSAIMRLESTPALESEKDRDTSLNHDGPDNNAISLQSSMILTVNNLVPSQESHDILILETPAVYFQEGEEGRIEGDIMTIPSDTNFESQAEVEMLREKEMIREDNEKDEREREERVAKGLLEKEDKRKKIALDKEEEKKIRDIAFAKLKADQLVNQLSPVLLSVHTDKIIKFEENRRGGDSSLELVPIIPSVDEKKILMLEETKKKNDKMLISSQQLQPKDEEKPLREREEESVQVSLKNITTVILSPKEEEYRARTIAFAKQRADQLEKQKVLISVRAAVIESEIALVLKSEGDEIEEAKRATRVKEDKEEEERLAAILEDWKFEENLLGLGREREVTKAEASEPENISLVEERREADAKKIGVSKAINDSKRAMDLSRARNLLEEIRIEMELKEKEMEEEEKKEAERVLTVKTEEQLGKDEEVKQQAERRRAEVQLLQINEEDKARAEMSAMKQEQEVKEQKNAEILAFQLKLQEEETSKKALLKKKAAESEFALSLETRQREAGEQIRRGEEKRLAMLDLKIKEEELLMERTLKEESENKLALAAFKVKMTLTMPQSDHH